MELKVLQTYFRGGEEGGRGLGGTVPHWNFEIEFSYSDSSYGLASKFVISKTCLTSNMKIPVGNV